MDFLPQDIENIIINYKKELEKLNPKNIFYNLELFNCFRCVMCEKVYTLEIKCENKEICFNCEDKELDLQKDSCCIL